LLSCKKISFREIDKREIEKSIYNIHQVVFEVTEKCNLNCVYCAFGEMYSGNEGRLKEKRNMRKEDAIKLLEYLYPVWKERKKKGFSQKIMIGFYGGEPLMNFPLIETIVQWANEHTASQLTFRFQLTINGLLLNKYTDFLVKHDFMTFISFDGNEKNMSYRIDNQGKNCFKQVYSNIMDVKKKYPDYFAKNVNFMAVLHNKNSIEQAVQFCMTHFNKVPSCTKLNDSGIHPQKSMLFSEMYETIPIKPSKKTEKAIMSLGMGLTGNINFLHSFSGFHFYGYNELFEKEDRNEIKIFPAGACIPFSREIYMTIDGNLYPCERLDSCFCMGNIHENNVLDADLMAYRYNQYFKNIMPTCSECKKKFACDKCLFHIDNIQKNKPKCNNYMTIEMFNNMVSSMIATFKKYPKLYQVIMKQKLMPL